MKTDEKNIEARNLHLGNLIKFELRKQGRTATWLAGEVHRSPENIYKICKQHWINLPLLFQISIALNHDFFKDCSDNLKKKKWTKREIF